MSRLRELFHSMSQLDSTSLLPSAEFEATLSEFDELLGRISLNDLDEVTAAGAVHSSPWVRHLILVRLTAQYPTHPLVHQLVAWLIHDYDDFVAFEAINSAAALRLSDVLPDLILIVGSASERLRVRAGKPVGIGHAVVLRAITRILGSDDPERLAATERDLFPDGRLPPPSEDHERGRNRAALTAGGSHGHESMRYVEPGIVRSGVPPAFARRELLFDWDDPDASVVCGGFHMDVTPVTVAEYDEFAGSSAAQEHQCCHAAEPRGKLHLRNTLLDARSGRSHPVTGVDWFDAYAFAAAQEKRLPTEWEWQRGAQGDDQRAFPWGDEFDLVAVHCAPEPDGEGGASLMDWRRELLRLADLPPSTTTRRVGVLASASPFGILDLAGNAWEWTSSASAGGLARPGPSERDAIDVIYDPRSYAVIKGGAWTSLPEQTSTGFRGKDLLLDRHFEIGFRCVCDCPPEP